MVCSVMVGLGKDGLRGMCLGKVGGVRVMYGWLG